MDGGGGAQRVQMQEQTHTSPASSNVQAKEARTGMSDSDFPLPMIDRKRELDGIWLDECAPFNQEDWDRFLASFRRRNFEREMSGRWVREPEPPAPVAPGWEQVTSRLAGKWMYVPERLGAPLSDQEDSLCSAWSATETQQAPGALTIEDLERVVQMVREKQPEPPMELLSPAEYICRRLPLSQETLAELGKPMGMLPYLRWCYDKIEIQPVHHPWLVEGTGTRTRKRPWTFTRIANRRRRWLKAYKRAQRLPKQHRAAFRRRKRGLA